MKYLYIAIPVIFDERKPIWWELVVPGIFTLVGSLIGAFLAGRYAVKSVKKQLEYDKDTKRIFVLESFLKQSFILTSEYKKIIDDAEELVYYLECEGENESISDDTLHLMERLIDEVENSIKKLTDIKMDLIPFDIYYEFKSSILLLNGFYYNADDLHKKNVDDNSVPDNEKDDYYFWTLSAFSDSVNKLKNNYKGIKNYEKISYDELNRIKKD